MNDLIQEGTNWLVGQLQNHVSQSVVYSRGSDSVTLNATIGKTDRETFDDHGFGVKSQVRDFLLKAEELILNNQKVIPRRGDRITQTLGTQSHVYEVVETGGDKHYRPSDPYGVMYRIHTQLMDING